MSSKPIEMANELNNKYIKKVKDFRIKLNSKNKKDPMKMLSDTMKRSEKCFKINEITTQQTINLLQSFNSSGAKGPDSITITHLKKAGPVIVEVIKHLINLSIQQSNVATILKETRISPLKKKGKSEVLALSYRPINNVSSVAKLLDRHVFSQLSIFMAENEIIHCDHHGGRAGHSTTTAMLDIHNKMAQIVDEGRIAALLTIDLSAAFDLCDHELMLKKLEFYGVRDSELKWFESYLSDRRQCVQIGAARSKSLDCPPCSVVQGSVGSGLLYTIYTNELPNIVPHYLPKLQEFQVLNEREATVSTVNFVDDSSTILSVQKRENLGTLLRLSYDCLSEYFTANLMVINADKTAALIAAKQYRDLITNTITFLADNYIIKLKINIKLLGYHLANNLKHDCHVIHEKESVLKKLIKRIAVIKRLSKYTEFKGRKMIANAIFNGTLGYLLPLWGTADHYIIKKVQILQLNAARAVIGHKCSMWSTAKMLKTLNWLSVSQMATFKLAITIHSSVMFNSPASLANQIIIKKLDPRTRGRALVQWKSGYIAYTEFARNMPLNRAMKFYNTIPIDIIQLNLKDFKARLKTYIKEKIPVIKQQYLL